MIRLGDEVVESGSNVGSDLALFRWNDAGDTALSKPLVIYRSTGIAEFFDGVKVSATTASTSPTTGALTVAGGVGVGGAIYSGGNIEVNKADPWVTLRKTNNGQKNIIFGMHNTVNRWDITLGNAATESGGASGSDFGIARYNDAGTYSGTPISITRSSGDVKIETTSASTSYTTGALTVAGGVGIGGSVNINGNITTTDGNKYLMLGGGNAAGRLMLGGFTDLCEYSINRNSVNGIFNDPTKCHSGVRLTTSTTSAGILFRTTTTPNVEAVDRVNIAGSGVVYVLSNIGASSPTTGSLVVAGGVGISGELHIGGGTGAPAATAYIKAWASSTYAALASKVNADANHWHMVFCNAANAVVGNISTNATNTSYSTASDGRLKEDLKTFDASGDIVDNTKVYDFRWKSSGERGVGMVAQEAYEIYPAAVPLDPGRDWWGIDYSKYVPVIMQELKSLRVRLKQLEEA